MLSFEFSVKRPTSRLILQWEFLLTLASSKWRKQLDIDFIRTRVVQQPRKDPL